ncbi:DNA polymerase III subunit delta' [Henriciella sp.]|uniref:DNA polymerase III subunit delta' n=1 Tax=Henriciella sp. TaxID=1968823 RepID=UPI0026075576|nr:DNA polymerase III subunit delta' [Henriciella sp.]
MSDVALPLFGHGEAQAEFLSAKESGRLHHAWIFEGPSGIGKARFATRLASVMLGAKPTDEDPAGAPVNDPVIQKILSSGHPDLKHVHREANEKGTLKQDISVDQVRDLNAFFSLKPALGGWRVGILDALDEMNISSLNAVLKTLEEPPPQAVLFLISHATAPVLPTIRSRCQTLRLKPLSTAETKAVLDTMELETPADMADLVRGRPGRAAELAGPKVMAAASAAQSLLKSMPSANEAQLSHAILSAGEDDQAFGIFAEEVLGWISDKADTEPGWSEVWFEGQQIIATQRSLHIPPAQAASKLVSCLQSAFASR